jgi:hypothetical protein
MYSVTPPPAPSFRLSNLEGGRERERERKERKEGEQAKSKIFYFSLLPI